MLSIVVLYSFVYLLLLSVSLFLFIFLPPPVHRIPGAQGPDGSTMSWSGTSSKS